MGSDSGKYVVFVDDGVISGSVSIMAGAAATTADARAPLSRADEIALRRAALAGLAADILAPGEASVVRSAGNVASAMGAEMGVAMGADDGGGAMPDLEGKLLAGIGAIVLDEDETDIASLEGVIGLTVVRDVEIELAEPEAAEELAGEDFWHLGQIGADEDPDAGEGILVGVLDTGIDADHHDFAGKTIHFMEFDSIGRQISDTPRDAGDHGTHVSSLVAGRQAGVARGVDLAVAAVLTNRNALGRMSGTLIQIINGLDWLITTAFRDEVVGVDIVNASLGGSGFNAYLQPGVRNARRIGVPFIAAIGNAGRNGANRHGSPGNYPESLGVGACDRTDTVADFSDWGVGPNPAGPAYPVPNLSAPGVGIWAARPGGGFHAKNGTSMATPIVTGIAAQRMAANPVLQGDPDALFVALAGALAPVAPHALGNLGGAGRIVA